jgi:hypothetical protein
MADDVTLQIAGWLERWFGRKERPTIVLVHCSSDGASSPLETVDPPEQGEEAPTASSIADRLVSQAQAHADSSTRVQRYAVGAQNRAGKVLGQHFFRLSSAEPLAGVGDRDTEPATPAGTLAQSMRHNEACMRMLCESIGQTMGRMGAQLDAQAKQIGAFMAQQTAQLEATQRIFDQEHIRNLELEQARATTARAERGAKMIENGLLPMLSGKMTGATDLAAFLRDLSQEQNAQIASVLTETQLERLGKLLKIATKAEKGQKVVLEAGAEKPTEEAPS